MHCQTSQNFENGAIYVIVTTACTRNQINFKFKEKVTNVFCIFAM